VSEADPQEFVAMPVSSIFKPSIFKPSIFKPSIFKPSIFKSLICESSAGEDVRTAPAMKMVCVFNTGTF